MQFIQQTLFFLCDAQIFRFFHKFTSIFVKKLDYDLFVCPISLLSALKKISLNGDFLVYDCRSGETHFLNESGLRILGIISESPVSIDQLLARIQDDHGMSEVEQLPAHLSALLDRFVELGIIVRNPASLAA